jgi:hypothetical protein
LLKKFFEEFGRAHPRKSTTIRVQKIEPQRRKEEKETQRNL